MTEYQPSEKALPIRYPSIANLMVDSKDRSGTVYPDWSDFQITKPFSILNGFFTRVGTTEVVLEWCQPNVADGYNNTLTLDLSGTGANAFAGSETFVIPEGFYTVEEAVDRLVEKINDLSGTTGVSVTVDTTVPNQVVLVFTDGVVAIPQNNNWGNLGIGLGFVGNPLPAPDDDWADEIQVGGVCADLRYTRYIDFVSSQLTYAQDVKDASTAPVVRDVLCRWYMAWDNPPDLDGYGFPILQGYTPFVQRRLYNPPKQIKWESNLPIGNLSFQVYDDVGSLLPNGDSEFLMTLQVSEV